MNGVLGFELLRPDQSVWLVLVPLLLAVGLLGLALRRRDRRALVAPQQQARFFGAYSENRARFRVLLAVAGAFWIAVALLGPVRGYTLREVERRGLDIVLCLDSSRSMLVQDVDPDRLTRAKREIHGLLDRLQGDRTALIAFSGDVRDVTPLTHDRETVKHFVDSISTEDNLMGGTNIGQALEHALAMFDGRTGAHEAICLITDGEDLEGRGLQVAEAAAERGIRIYVVGMASVGGGKIPGRRGGFTRDESGQEVVSALDEASLRRIADLSDGAFVSVERSAFPLEELYEKRMTKLETRDLWAGKEKIPHDRYQWALVLALLCLLGEAALRERRPLSRAERARLALTPTRAATTTDSDARGDREKPSRRAS